MEKINRKDLIDEVSERAHISKKDSENAIRAMTDIMEEALLASQEVNIKNFGTFTPKTKKSRIGTDPKSHSHITIKETKTITFKPAKSLKEKFNK